MSNWSHKSLEGPPPEYAIRYGRVMKGSLIIATFRPNGKVWTVDGRLIGEASSNAEAMLMAIRDHENAPPAPPRGKGMKWFARMGH